MRFFLNKIHMKISTRDFNFHLRVTQFMVQVGSAEAAVYSEGRIGKNCR